MGYTEEAKVPSPLAESYPLRPPYAKTEAATSVSETQATLNGLVNPSGSETKYWFEYGPTTSYGTKTSEAGAGSGMSNLEESSTITGLSGTTYHYRVVGTSSLGTIYGKDGTFTAGIPGALDAMAVTDPFNGTTSAVSNFAGNWSALGWATEKGLNRSSGWGPSAAYPTVAGAYYTPTIADVNFDGLPDLIVAPGINRTPNVQIYNVEWKVFLQDIQLKQPVLYWASWIGDFPDPFTFMQLFQSGFGMNYGDGIRS